MACSYPDRDAGNTQNLVQHCNQRCMEVVDMSDLETDALDVCSRW